MYLLKLMGIILTSHLSNDNTICSGKDDFCPTKNRLQNTVSSASRRDSAVTCQIVSRSNEERELKIAPQAEQKGLWFINSRTRKKNSLWPLLRSQRALDRRSGLLCPYTMCPHAHSSVGTKRRAPGEAGVSRLLPG